MTECPICIEKYNKVLRREIVCFNCNRSSCSSCIRKYILQSSTEAKCLHCNIQWDRRFMVNNLTRKFCDKDYRQHRLEILYQRNKCFMPRICEIYDIRKEISKIDKIKEEHYKELEENNRKIYEKIQKLDEERNNQYNIVRRMEREFVHNRIIANQEKKEHSFNRPCITEECLGFLNNKGNCPVCKKQTCLKCNIDITDLQQHECKDDDVQQWECLKKTTRPCPSCRVRIYKITGCDQMWCTHCNTAFSWKTGSIETGPVHNPHYFDWLFEGGGNRTNNNNNAVDICNQNNLPPFNLVSSAVKKKLNISLYDLRQAKDDKIKLILNYYRSLVHLENVELNALNTTEQNYRRGLLPHLYNLLKNNKNSKKGIEQYDYKKECDRELSQIVETYLQQQRYNYHSLVLDDNLSCEDFIKEMVTIMNFYTSAIELFEKEYGRSYRSIKYYMSSENIL